MKHWPLILLSLLLVALVQVDRSGSYLPAVLLGMAVAHGAVLLVAAAELSNAKWIAPLRRHLLAFAPWQLVFPLLINVAPYPWRHQPGTWLSTGFFLARDFVLLLVCAVLALVYRRATLSSHPARAKLAVAYIFGFVVTETVISMDWVMSLDVPWISTMFPALYMIEALYAGLAVAGVLCFLWARRSSAGLASNVVYDNASLLFGFALFWGGLYFAQYLTIWYGNIPEEVHYFTGRLARPAGMPLLVASVLLLFAIPFFALLVHRARRSPAALLGLSGVVLVGLFLYRLFHVFSRLQLRAALVATATLIVSACVLWIVRRSLRMSE